MGHLKYYLWFQWQLGNADCSKRPPILEGINCQITELHGTLIFQLSSNITIYRLNNCPARAILRFQTGLLLDQTNEIKAERAVLSCEVTWTTLISVFAKQDNTQQSLNWFEKMRQRGSQMKLHGLDLPVFCYNSNNQFEHVFK
jgi:pentatricopeptide repeat protein